jgi:hypothetical protein
MDASKFQGACAFAIGLAITLFLAAYLTPRGWWRRPNARALLVMVAGAWGFGSLILYFAHGGAPAAIAPASPASASTDAPAAPPAALIAGQPFQVHRDLNLRAAAGVDTARLVTVPAGATVTPTGARDGDWWQVKARVAGRDTEGWVSSLWLRRSGE